MFPNGRSAAKVWSAARQLDVRMAERRGTLTMGEFAELRARERLPKESPCDDNDSHATCLIRVIIISDTRDNVCMHRVCCHMHKHGEQLITNGSCVW